MSKLRKILVTSALPYANGSIHIGHLVEYIQTDVWVRFQKARGHDCHYVCADDTHGTPIMLSARKQGITPEELIGRMHEEHTRDFAGFSVNFDNYYTTNSDENRQFAELIYARLVEGNHIAQRDIQQAYCTHDTIFLPDRLIRGTCPKCSAPDQYGDSCEICSATYSPTDLKDARCAVCGNAPETRSSRHYFFKLGDFEQPLQQWLAGGHIQEEIRKKVSEWFTTGLQDWDISRDAPYFGFKIPGTDDKYFYVWLDAPIGYMASTKNWAERTGRTFDEFWLSPDAEIVHFIGKDIVYFHVLFWPAMLMGAKFQTPSKVFVHGFLTVDGQKMSKSRGTFITAREYLNHLPPEALRYYYACKLGPNVEDIDLNLADFVARVNADLGNNFANLGSRVIAFLNKRLDSRMGVLQGAGLELVEAVEAKADEIAALYDGRDYANAMRRIMELCTRINKYVADSAPWELIKTDAEAARNVCTAAVNAFGKIAVLLSPVVPGVAARSEAIIGFAGTEFGRITQRFESCPINTFESVFNKILPEDVEKMVEASKPREEPAPATQPAYTVDPLQEPLVDINGFRSVDLRVAKVIEAKGVEGADKLLQLTIDLGPLGQRNIFAGIRKSHDPEALVGRLIVVVANLQPRKMKFGVSQGMLLAAGPGDKEVFLLGPESGALPGQRIG